MTNKEIIAWFNTYAIDKRINRYKNTAEVRYNPYHDTKTGRFTTKSGNVLTSGEKSVKLR